MSANVDQNNTNVLGTTQTNLTQTMVDAKDKQEASLMHLLMMGSLLEQMIVQAKGHNVQPADIKSPTTPAASVQPLNVTTPPEPILDPQLAKDMEAWFESLERYNELVEELKALSKKKNIHNMSQYIMQVMSLVMDMSGAQVAELSAADNVGTDIRNMLGNALDEFNGIAGGKSGDPNLANMAKKFMGIIDSIQAFLTYESNLPQNKQVMGGDAVKQMQDAINTLKEPFTNYEGDGTSIWGNPTAMAAAINSMGQVQNGQYDPNFKDIEDSFNTLNQTVSAFSTATNTSLQYKVQNIKQYMGMEEAEIQSTQSSTSTMVRNQRTN